MAVFDDILGSVAAEDRAIFEKYPHLKNSVETLEKNLGETARYANGWINWKNENWDDAAGMTKREKELNDALAAANARITSAAASGADAATIDALKADFEKKLKDVQTESLRAVEGMNYFYRAAASRLLPHQREFGEDFDSAKLMQYMQEHKINDPDVAYDRMMAPRRAELATQHQQELDKKHQEEIQAAEQRGREKAAQELAMGPHGVLPTDHTGGIVGVTAHMQKPTQVTDAEKAAVSEAKLGDGSLARLGYEKYVRGEYSGATQ